MNIFVYYPKCSTCKNAKKWLEENNVKFKERDIVLENLNYDEIKEIVSKSGLDIKKFFNTSGLKYKALNLKEKLQYFSDEEKLKLLASDGMLVKRPILICDNKVLVGFKQEEWKKLI